MATLRDLLIVELSDLLDAEEQILRELPVMAARATAPELRALFDDHYRETRRHRDRLQHLFERLDERPRVVICHGVRGLVEEARDRHATWDPGEVLDAALIGAAQRLEHYEMAGYGCARTYAATLRDHDAARVLQQTLDEERQADRRLSALAEANVNPRATVARPRLAWSADTDAVAAPRSRANVDDQYASELMVARGEPEWRADEVGQLGRNRTEETKPVEKRE
jgi:ferritin-like metal-binding protein YciE